jgi:hypothetical protein
MSKHLPGLALQISYNIQLVVRRDKEIKYYKWNHYLLCGRTSTYFLNKKIQASAIKIIIINMTKNTIKAFTYYFLVYFKGFFPHNFRL